MPATAADSSSPRAGLSRLRRNKGSSNTSTPSFNADSGEDESSGQTGFRASVDAAIDKVKERTKSSGDRRGSDDSQPNRLSSLVRGRNRVPASNGDAPGLEGQSSTQSGNSGDGNWNRSGLSLPGAGSESSSGQDGSGRSSLLTDENSDHDGTQVRPSLSPHHSHIGYLTQSSPELSTKSQPIASVNDFDPSPEILEPNDSSTNLPLITEPEDLEPSQPSASTRRSRSPAGRLRDAFALPRKNSKGDTVSRPTSSAAALGGLFKSSSRRSSVSARVSNEPNKVNEQEAGASQTESKLKQNEESKRKEVNSEERPETPQNRSRPRLNTIPTPATPPNIVETPTVLVVTPPTPTDVSFDFSRAPTSSSKSGSPGNKTFPLSSVESIRHRRAQSANLPSKLSTSTPAPLTPTLEEAKTPGGTLTQPANAAGFFSSFFSAAQKAADQLSTNLNTSVGQINKVKSVSQRSAQDQGLEEIVVGSQIGSDTEGVNIERKSYAVETLGTGNLSLGHLGLAESQEVSPMGSTVDLPEQISQQTQSDDANNKAEEEAAARAVSVAYDKPVQTVASQSTGRPLSISSTDRLTLTGEQTPPRPGVTSGNLQRSGSIRSKLSGRKRRHRASSATAGTTNSIAAAIQHSTSGLANLQANGTGHRLTGFAVASSKRNKDFHQLFRSVPEDDYLIEDYSAALQRDILLHGRLYVSEGHLCFSSNILGWVTNLVISFDEVVSVEKKNTAVIFPNAIVVQTLHARNTFASFVARDSTYELLIGIWKISHPNLKSSLNGVTLDNAGTGDKTEVADLEGSGDETADGSDDEVYDEDVDDDAGSFTDAGILASAAGSDIGDTALSRKTSAVPVNGIPQANGGTPKGSENTDAAAATATASSDFPGPPAHAPTECTEVSEHYERPLIDTTIPAPLGKVYSMMFGPASGAFMRRWLVEDQKSRELNYPDDKIGLDNDHKSMNFDYIKPLNAPVGPKQTKCITTNTLLAFDLDRSVTIDCSTQTPDVPSGNIFTTKTRYCLMWGPGNSTRVVASCVIEWTGKSWLRGPIEKGANDGQTAYIQTLVAAIKAAVTTKPPVKGTARKGGKRKGKKDEFNAGEANAQRETTVVSEQKTSDWGLFEPLHQILGLVGDLVRPFITSQVIIAVLFVLLVYTWLAPPRSGPGVGLPGHLSRERLVAYEEIWRSEENELWDWLEDRVGLDGVHAPTLSKSQEDRQKVLAVRKMGKNLDGERMSERLMDDAIGVTEKKLAALKDAVERKKAKKKKPSKVA